MRAIPSFRPAALAVAFAFASTTGVLAFERILPAPRIKDNGEVRLSDDLRIGRFQGGKFISQPDAVQIQGPGSTGPIDAMTVGGLALSTALGSKAPNASPIFTGIAGFNAFQGGYPGGAVDPPSYALSPFALSQYATTPGTHIPLHVQLGVGVTGATTSYEKDAIRGWCETQDPSTATILKDCVGVAGYGWIGTQNKNGRTWGLYGEGRARAGGGDGLVYGAELAIFNDGSDQPSIDQATSKYAAFLTTSGSSPATAAIFLTRGAGSTFHHGLIANPGIIKGDPGDSFIKLVNTFQVAPDGSLAIGYTPPNPVAKLDVSGLSVFRNSPNSGPLLALNVGPSTTAIEGSFASGGHVPIDIKSGGAVRWSFGVDGKLFAPATSAGQLQTGGTTVGGLPACNAGNRGSRLYVTDANAPSFLGVLLGGGSTTSPAFCNGASWVSG